MEPTRHFSPRRDSALFVLGGWPRQDSHGIWHSSLFDRGGIGDRLRVEAAAVLYHAAPQSIIVTGGKGKLAHLPDAVPCASVMKRELVELGVPASHILTETSSASTYQQLQHIKIFLAQFPLSDLRIISNRYHLPRIQAFLNNDPRLHLWCTHGRICTQAAEDTLALHNPARWQTLIDEAYVSPAMQERQKEEQQGVEAILAGTYQYQDPR